MAEPPSGKQSSIAFDQALEFYDRTRSLPPDAMEAVLGLLTRELAERQPCIEIGVGTGRMALPLAERGIRMVGVDLSLMMLGELRRKAGASPTFPVAGGDAVHLPFADAWFGAGLAVHVLHLIPAWGDALAELARVVRRPGVVLVDTGGLDMCGLNTGGPDVGEPEAGDPKTGWWPALEERFCAEASIPFEGVGLRRGDDVDAHMASLGAHVRKLERIDVERATTIAERIDWLEAGVFSYTWRADEATRRSAADRCRVWAENRWGPLDEPVTISGSVVYRAYDLT